MLPKGWKLLPFSEVAVVGSGQVDPKKEPYASMIHIGPENIESGTGRVISPQKCSELGLISGKYEFDEEALVYSKIRPHLNKVCFPGFKGVCSADAYPIWPDKSKLIPEYLKHYMLGSAFEKRAVVCSMRTGMPKINREDLDGIPLVVPPLPEQRRIANILSTWDQSIVTAERLFANSQMQLAALLQQLLIKPAIRGDWPTVAIGEISERVQRRADTEETLPVLMISSGSGFVRQDEKYSRFMAGKSVENYIALDRGEFAYNKGNSKLYEFGCIFPLYGYFPRLVPNVYVCFRLLENCNPGFYEHLFRADFLHDQLGALVNTGVRNNGLLNIRPADFLACEVPVPPLDEQQRVAEILAAATAWVEQHERGLDLLKQEKAALMAKLLTGKRRVKLPTAETEARA
jgi:type I restriction enzyme S subunit